MKKFLAAAAITIIAFAGTATTAQAASPNGHGYGVTVQNCLHTSVGKAIQAGKIAHPGASMTAKSIAESPHCAV